MNRPSAERPGVARVAVVGAPTRDGLHVREALADFGVSGDRVDLYADTAGEVMLSEYAGEARMIQQAVLEEIVGHDVIFLCDTGQTSRGVPKAASGTSLVIDLQGSLPPECGARPIGIDGPPVVVGGDRPTCYSVPHSLAWLLAEVLGPLERAVGVDEAIAFILRPASDFGDEGVEELREQTVRLLNFSPVPTITFGRQLAFNVIPQEATAGGECDLDRRVATEVGELLGWTERRLAIRMLTVPLFHGHGLQLRFRPREPAGIEAVRGALESAGLVPAGAEDGPRTPLEVATEPRTILTSLTEDGLGGFWLWGVAGEIGPRGARQAVRLAVRMAGL